MTLPRPNYRAIAYADGFGEHVEVFDHRSDPAETANIAQDLPTVAKDIVAEAVGLLPERKNP